MPELFYFYLNGIIIVKMIETKLTTYGNEPIGKPGYKTSIRIS
jgi:hypothetical protein